MVLKRTFLLAALAAASAASSAHAQCGAYGAGGYGYGYWDIGRLYSVLADNVPYYAAFPPVYYSQPVPRTYGYSPFAYPPGVMTPDVEAPQPQVIDNPYVEPVEPKAEEVQPPPVNPTTSLAKPVAPLAITNPYVIAPTKLATAR